MSKKPDRAEFKRRLLVLADTLHELPRKRFNYGHWVGEDWKGKPDLSCGTTACALGWATTIPEFKRRGLRLVHDPRHGSHHVTTRGLSLCDAEDSISAAAKEFGLNYDEATFLFTPTCYFVFDNGKELESPGCDSTPKQVAKHIRKFVQNWED